MLRFDQTLSATSQVVVLRSDNWPVVSTSGGTNTYADLDGPFVTGVGASAQIWMADISYDTTPDVVTNAGIRRWNVTASGTIATNDLGKTIVAARDTSDLTRAPYAVTVDASNRIYTIQNVTDAGNPANRVFRFPASTNADVPELLADWKIGGTNDALRGASGVAVDASAANVAVAFRGLGGQGTSHSGASLQVFSATNGAAITTLMHNPDSDYPDVAWDNAGNLYALDAWYSVWLVYSPPGSNALTTVALQPVQIGTIITTPPELSGPVWTNNVFQFTLSGQPNVAYVIYGSMDLLNWTALATNQAPTTTRTITLPALAAWQYYKAVPVGGVTQPTTPVFSLPTWATNQFRFTLTGEASVPYVILTSTDLVNWVPVVTNRDATAIRSIPVPATGPRSFYRAEVGK